MCPQTIAKSGVCKASTVESRPVSTSNTSSSRIIISKDFNADRDSQVSNKTKQLDRFIVLETTPLHLLRHGEHSSLNSEQRVLSMDKSTMNNNPTYVSKLEQNGEFQPRMAVCKERNGPTNYLLDGVQVGLGDHFMRQTVRRSVGRPFGSVGHVNIMGASCRQRAWIVNLCLAQIGDVVVVVVHALQGLGLSGEHVQLHLCPRHLLQGLSAQFLLFAHRRVSGLGFHHLVFGGQGL